MTPLKSLDPDFLKDSIVELRYSSEFPFEVVVGQMYPVLLEAGFEYVTASNNQIPQGPTTINLNLSHSFQKEPISLRIQRNSIIFNLKEKYPKWEEYYNSVKEAYALFTEKALLSSINRVGLRYINVFDNNVFDNVSDSVQRIKISEFETDRTKLTTEITDQNHRIILNIGNGYPSGKAGEVISLLDIDVIFEKDPIIEMDQVFKIIEECHVKEKEVFEKIMNKKFLEKRKAQYD